MKTKVLLLAFFVLGCSINSVSQTSQKSQNLPYKKNQIGLQLNPYLNTNEIFDSFVYGARYGYTVARPLTLGAEIAGSFPAFNNAYIPYSNFKIGMFARYTFFTEKRIRGFLEASPFFAHTFVRGSEFYPGNTVMNNFGLYFAPGLSFYTKSRKVSFDVYYKFYLHPSNFYYHENVISYKVNFHF